MVQLGESTWSSWEPREGEFQFAWMERIIDRLHKAGIRVILGSPTYSIQSWLYRKYPEILVALLGGDKRFYGPRQNMDITHPTYRYYAERVIRQVVSDFKNHPAIICPGYPSQQESLHLLPRSPHSGDFAVALGAAASLEFVEGHVEANTTNQQRPAGRAIGVVVLTAGHIAEINEIESRLFADLPGTLQSRHGRGRRGKPVRRIVRRDVPGNFPPQRHCPLGDFPQRCLRVIHTGNHQGGDLNMHAAPARKGARSPYLFDIN